MWRCSLCNKKFRNEKAVCQHARDYHKGRAGEVTPIPPKRDREPSLADEFVDAQVNRAMGIENPEWLEKALGSPHGDLVAEARDWIARHATLDERRKPMSRDKTTDACLAKVKPGEPIFVLRAQDKLAPAVVRMWAEIANLHDAPDEKVDEAVDLAADMEMWAIKNGSKYPD